MFVSCHGENMPAVSNVTSHTDVMLTYAGDAGFQRGRMRNEDPSSRPPNNHAAKSRCRTEFAVQSLSLSGVTEEVGVHWYTANLMHFRHPGFDIIVVRCVASDAKDTLKSNLSGQCVRTETHL